MLLALLSLCAVTAKSLSDQPSVLDAATDQYASAYVFVASPVGIYAFNRTTAIWTRFSTAGGLPDNRVSVFGLDDGILWVGTPLGLASADMSVNDWQTYPAGPVTGLAFDRSYVWAATDSVLLRFDKYAERWDTVSNIGCHDICADGTLIWLATDSGIRCYNSEYSRLEAPAVEPDTFRLLLATPSRIWFFGTQRTLACGPGGETWSSYPPLLITDWSAVGDSLFVVADGRLSLYDPAADNWRTLSDLPLPGQLRGICAATDTLTAATSAGLFTWSLAGRSGRNLTTADGMTDENLLACFADNRYTYAVSASGIDLFDRQSGIWRFERFTTAATRAPALVALDDAGAHLRLIPDTDIRLTGTASLSDTRSLADLGAGNPVEAARLALTGRHQSGRTLSLYYDDTDQSQLDYGLTWRGAARDVLARAGAGRFDSDYYEFGLVPAFALLGASARLRRGPHSLNLQAGRTHSRRHADFFLGRSAEQQVGLRDLDYARRVFYALPSSVDSRQSSIAAMLLRRSRRPESGIRNPNLRSRNSASPDTIFSDDHDPATNGPGTRAGITIAGILGDWDVLIRGLDYHVNPDSGLVRFVEPRGPDETVVAVSGGIALLLQSGTTSTAEVNHYALGPNIIPGSLDMSITDTLGNIHSLAEFGLDDDADGRVDPWYVDHDQGYLRFPAARPFPDAVYDETTQVFSLSARYLTTSTSYYLSHRPVQKNSEQVWVDAELLTRGPDYVIAYSSGQLTILRRDLITSQSRIDVQYSAVDEDSSGLLLSAQPDIAVTDRIHVAPGFTTIDSSRIAHLSARAETGSGNKTAIFVPAVACDLNGSLAQNHRLTAGYGIASLRAEYLGYSAAFPAFGAATTRYGDLRHKASAQAGIEPLFGLRIDAGCSAEFADDSAGISRRSVSAHGRLGYTSLTLPSGHLQYGREFLPDRTAYRVRAGLGHEVAAIGSRLKLAANGQSTRAHLAADSIETALEYTAEAGLALPVPVQTNVWLRSSNAAAGTRQSSAATSSESELRARLTIDAIPGLVLASSYNHTAAASRQSAVTDTSTLLRRTRNPESGIRNPNLRSRNSAVDVALAGSFYNDLQVAPGRWYGRLSIVNFSLGSGRSYGEYLPARGPDWTRPLLITAPLNEAGVSRSSDLATLYGTVTLSPLANLSVRLRHSLNRSGQALYSLPDLRPTTEDELRVEYQPGNWGTLTFLGTSRTAALYPENRLRTTYFDWTRPWSALFQTRLTVNYRNETSDYQPGWQTQTELRANIQPLYRLSERSYVTADLGAARSTSNSSTPILPEPLNPRTLEPSASAFTLLPGATVNLNLFRFLYFHLGYTATLPLSGTVVHTLTARITGQL